jgi:hypothetical protein
MELGRTKGCIIRISDPKTCPILVVCRVFSFAYGEKRQRQIVDGPPFRRRLLTAVACLLPEDCFPGSLTLTKKLKHRGTEQSRGNKSSVYSLPLCFKDFAEALGRNQRSYLFAGNHAFNVSMHVQIENHNWKIIFLAK